MSEIPKETAAKEETIPLIGVPWRNLPLTRLIHQNFSVIMGYSFSQPVLAKWVDDRFTGEWKYLAIVPLRKPYYEWI